MNGIAIGPSRGARVSAAITMDDSVVTGSRNDTVSVPDWWFQSATVAPDTWLTVTPSGTDSVISRAAPCTTSVWTLAVIWLLSSPSATSDVTRARVRSDIVARRSSLFRFHANVIGRPGEP